MNSLLSNKLKATLWGFAIFFAFDSCLFAKLNKWKYLGKENKNNYEVNIDGKPYLMLGETITSYHLEGGAYKKLNKYSGYNLGFRFNYKNYISYYDLYLSAASYQHEPNEDILVDLFRSSFRMSHKVPQFTLLYLWSNYELFRDYPNLKTMRMRVENGAGVFLYHLEWGKFLMRQTLEVAPAFYYNSLDDNFSQLKKYMMIRTQFDFKYENFSGKLNFDYENPVKNELYAYDLRPSVTVLGRLYYDLSNNLALRLSGDQRFFEEKLDDSQRLQFQGEDLNTELGLTYYF